MDTPGWDFKKSRSVANQPLTFAQRGGAKQKWPAEPARSGMMARCLEIDREAHPEHTYTSASLNTCTLDQWVPWFDNTMCILPSSTSSTSRAPRERAYLHTHYTCAALALGSDSRRGTSRVGGSMGQAHTPRERAPTRMTLPYAGQACERGGLG